MVKKEVIQSDKAILNNKMKAVGKLLELTVIVAKNQSITIKILFENIVVINNRLFSCISNEYIEVCYTFQGQLVFITKTKNFVYYFNDDEEFTYYMTDNKSLLSKDTFNNDLDYYNYLFINSFGVLYNSDFKYRHSAYYYYFSNKIKFVQIQDLISIIDNGKIIDLEYRIVDESIKLYSWRNVSLEI